MGEFQALILQTTKTADGIRGLVSCLLLTSFSIVVISRKLTENL